MYTLGINFSHHASVALLKDNEVVFFVLEERLNRFKEWGGPLCPKDSGPFRSLSQIKKITSNIDLVVGISGAPTQLKACVDFLKKNKVNVISATINNSPHHLFHAASIFYSSPFRNASCLVIDGSGATVKFKQGVRANETTSVYEIDYEQGIRCTYKKFTIGIYDAGGVKKLSEQYPASKNIPVDVSQQDIENFKNSSSLKNDKFLLAERIEASTRMDIGMIYHCTSSQIKRALDWRGWSHDGKMMGFAAYGNKPNSTEWENFAYETQKELEQYFIDMVKYCKHNNLLMGGGCALNILGNSAIKKYYPHINLYPDPIAHDGTIALGAAAYHFYGKTKCKDKLITSAYTGMDYNITKDHVYEYTRKYSV